MKILTAFVASTGLLIANSGATWAGGMAEPMMEPEVIVEETAASGNFIVPLILLAVIIAAVSGNGGGGTSAKPLK